MKVDNVKEPSQANISSADGTCNSNFFQRISCPASLFKYHQHGSMTRSQSPDHENSRKVAPLASTSMDTFSCLQMASQASSIRLDSSISTRPPAEAGSQFNAASFVSKAKDDRKAQADSCGSVAAATRTNEDPHQLQIGVARSPPPAPMTSPFSDPPAWLPALNMPGASTPPGHRKMNSLAPLQASKRSFRQKFGGSVPSLDNSTVAASYATGDEVSSMADDFTESLLEQDSEDSTTCTDIASIATDPNVIAIGIPADQPKSEQNAKINRDKISELVANDIAEKEHNLKMRASGPVHAVVERRLSSPCTAGRSLAEVKLNNNVRVSSFTTRMQPRRSFLESLDVSNPSLLQEPNEIAMDRPPSRPASTRSMDSCGGSDTMSHASSIVVTPRMRGRKGQALGNSLHGLNALDRQQKVRAARASMTMGNVARLCRPPKAHSLGSCSPPPIPVRRNSADSITCGDEAPMTERSQSAENAMFLSSSANSVATSSSGRDLDEKTRNNIISRSASMHIARRQSSVRVTSDDTKGPSSLRSIRSKTSADSETEAQLVEAAATAASSAVAGEENSSDQKNVARISRLSLSEPMPQNHNRGPTGEQKSVHCTGGGPAATVTSRTISREQDKLRNSGLSLAPGDESEQKAQAVIPAQEGEANEYYGGLPFQPVMASDIPDEEQEGCNTRNLEAQAGVPVVLPGAFAVRPISGGGDQMGQPSSGYDSGFEEVSVPDEDRNAPVDTSSPRDADTPEQRPAFRPVVSAAPVDAELYEVDYADAQVLDPAETEKAIRRRVRLLQGFLVLLCLVIATSITVGVMYSGKDDFQSCEIAGGKCVPAIRGWTQLGNLLTGPTDSDSIQYGYSVAMSGDGNRVAIGLPGMDAQDTEGTTSRVGGVYIMDFNGTQWTTSVELQGLEADGNAGTAVTISKNGKRVAYGAPGTEAGGYAAMYEEAPDGSWDLVGGLLEAFSGTNAFGTSLALSSDGSILTVGDKYASLGENLTDVGTIRSFQEVDRTWKQLGRVISGNEANDLFGWSVALSDDGLRIAASAIGADRQKGGVRVFGFEDGDWVQVGQSLLGEADRETFGASVALGKNGNVMAVGATGYAEQGSSIGRVRTYSFDPERQTWAAHGEPINGDAQFDRFGSAVSLSVEGDILAIGSPQNDIFGSNAGYVKIMMYGDSGWAQVGSILGRSDSEGGLFGSCLALSAGGHRFVGGAPELTYDGKLSKIGRVWAYEHVGK